MRRWLGGTLVAATLVATPIGAQAASGADFSPLAFLVGSCWVGEFPGGKMTDEHCFEWMYDRKFIRDRHVVRGGKPYEGESLYGWDAANKRIAFWYFNSAGQVTTGHFEFRGDTITIPERVQTAKGVVEQRATWTRVGDDTYRIWQGQLADGAWKTLWTMDMKRRR